jgi:hypothetical protein
LYVWPIEDIIRGMKPYASDLRDRIIRVLESGEEPPGTMAERFWVRLSVVEKRWQRFRRSGRRAAQPHAGGKRRARKDHPALLRREVKLPIKKNRSTRRNATQSGSRRGAPHAAPLARLSTSDACNAWMHLARRWP